jgi:hypothetical protein
MLCSAESRWFANISKDIATGKNKMLLARSLRQSFVYAPSRTWFHNMRK